MQRIQSEWWFYLIVDKTPHLQFALESRLTSILTRRLQKKIYLSCYRKGVLRAVCDLQSDSHSDAGSCKQWHYIAVILLLKGQTP